MACEISLLPFKDTNKNEMECLMQNLASVNFFASMLPEIALPTRAYNSQRQQYDARSLLRYIHQRANQKRILGVTERDLYVEGLNFVFGIAESPGRAAIISLHRLSMGVDTVMFRERTLKEAVHELGHTFGLEHCPDPFCVMHFSNCLDDTDRKGKEYCPQCCAKLRTSSFYLCN